jgi:hypothetical protein
MMDERQQRWEQTQRRKAKEVGPRAVKVDSRPTDETALESDPPPG